MSRELRRERRDLLAPFKRKRVVKTQKPKPNSASTKKHRTTECDGPTRSVGST